MDDWHILRKLDASGMDIISAPQRFESSNGLAKQTFKRICLTILFCHFELLQMSKDGRDLHISVYT